MPEKKYISNEERTKNYKKRCNEFPESTNKINPLTGKIYDYELNLRTNLDFRILSTIDFFNLRELGFYRKPVPEMNDFTKYQFVLASMNVANGKMLDKEYISQWKNAEELIKRMDNAGISLDLINDVRGFDSALKKIEMENRPIILDNRAPLENLIMGHYHRFGENSLSLFNDCSVPKSFLKF